MPGARVSFLVHESPKGDTGPLIVKGAEIRIPFFGSGKTGLKKDAPQPVSLKFFGRYLTEALPQSPPAFEEFAQLSLEGELKGMPLRPELKISATAKIVYNTPPEDDDPKVRTLELDYNAQDFSNLPVEEHEIRKLKLPIYEPQNDLPEPRHFELGILLEVGGHTEAAVEVNDVLDVPLKPIDVGLIVEWPRELDELASAGLTLQAIQGKIKRFIRWVDGDEQGEVRRFLFRGVLGSEPVDLIAMIGKKEHQLWKQVDISDHENPIEWENKLEDVLQPIAAEEPLDFALQVESVQKTDPQVGPSKLSEVDPFGGEG